MVISEMRASKLARYYRRMACAVQAVRQAALASLDLDQYLVAQAVVLYGLLRYPEYQRPDVVVALGHLARRL
jgi:hypothetical protein